MFRFATCTFLIELFFLSYLEFQHSSRESKWANAAPDKIVHLSWFFHVVVLGNVSCHLQVNVCRFSCLNLSQWVTDLEKFIQGFVSNSCHSFGCDIDPLCDWLTTLQITKHNWAATKLQPTPLPWCSSPQPAGHTPLHQPGSQDTLLSLAGLLRHFLRVPHRSFPQMKCVTLSGWSHVDYHANTKLPS